MTPGERAWINKVLPAWRAKRDALIGWDDSHGLLAFDSVIQRLERRLEEAGPEIVAAAPSQVEQLRERLRICSPRPHPHYPDVIICTGPIMAAVRGDIEKRLRALTGEAPAPVEISFGERMRQAARAGGPPAQDPTPFAAGEQMGMFA